MIYVELIEIESGKKVVWTVAEVLKEINRDRSELWFPYNNKDWKEGWYEWCEGDVYKLVRAYEVPKPQECQR